MIRFVPLLIFAIFAAMAVVMLLQKDKPEPTHSIAYALPEIPIHAMGDASKAFALSNGISVLNFFASWCAPCIEEHKELLALKEQFPRVTFHGIAWNETKKNITAMLKEHGNPYDHIWDDARGRAAINLGLRGVPETFIVKNGEVVYHLSGPITPALRTSEIEPLLATP